MSFGVGAAVSEGIPSCITLGQARRYVGQYVGAPDDLERLDDATFYINNGIDAIINSRNWKLELRGETDLTLVADDLSYALPTDFRRPRHAHFLDPSGNRRAVCRHLQEKVLETENAWQSSSGDPCYYRIDYQNRLLLLDTKPSSGFVSQYPTLRLWYHVRHEHLSGTNDCLVTPNEFAQAILWYARWEMALAVNQDQAKIVLAERQWQRLLSQLEIDDNDTQTDWD